MRNPIRVLNSLSDHSKYANYKYERLYRVLFNEEMFYLAYQRIYAKMGNMTKGSDGKTIDEMSLSRISKLMEELKDETYQPKPARRTYIPKKDGKKRPLGIPSFDDKLVQEVLRMILEAIFEKQFEDSSHGFRPQRSCHTALVQIHKRFTGTKWFIEGDIKGFFDNINHHVLISILEERISDDRFLRLIRKFLNAGYIEDWTFHRTYSGTPQGGIISPILANVYLDKLDKHMKVLVSKFNKGIRRERNPEYEVLNRKKAALVTQLKRITDYPQKERKLREIKEVEKVRSHLASRDEMDANYKRLKYVRYADDFLVSVIGSKADSEFIKREIKLFLSEKLRLELSEDKTLITHAHKPAKFLGYEINIRKPGKSAKRSAKTGVISRVFGNKVILKLSTETMRKKLFDYRVLQMKQYERTEKWKPVRRTRLMDNDDLEILDTYNAEIRGFHNYYSIAHNSSALHSFRYIMEYSMYKTFANKYRTSVRKIIAKFRFNKDFAVFFTTKQGEIKMRVFHKNSFKRKTEPMINCDNFPNIGLLSNTTSLVDRLKACLCELCGKSDNLEMHHVRKLGDLRGKAKWEALMIARRRKTMAVCQECHKKIHAGKMD